MNEKMTSWERVNLARNIKRPTSLEYINNIFEDFIELKGDRGYGDDKAIVGGIARFMNKNVTVIGIQKGNNTKENIERNFGMAKPEGYRKALRLMLQAEKFNRPIITFVDTPGAFCGIESEERGIGEAVAKNLMTMSTIKVPIISIIIGEGGSGGALALAVADEIWMLENSIYSVLSPEGFASILYKDASKAMEAAERMKITSEDLLNLGVIERVIKEPIGGAQEDPNKIFLSIKTNLNEILERMNKESIESILTKRYYKFKKIGKYIE